MNGSLAQHTGCKLHRRCRSVEQSALESYTRQIDNIRLYVVSFFFFSLLTTAAVCCRLFFCYCVFFSSLLTFRCNWPHNYYIQTCNDDIYFQFDFPLCILVFIFLGVLFRCYLLFRMRVHIFVQCVTLIEQKRVNSTNDYEYSDRTLKNLYFMCVHFT